MQLPDYPEFYERHRSNKGYEASISVLKTVDRRLGDDNPVAYGRSVAEAVESK